MASLTATTSPAGAQTPPWTTSYVGQDTVLGNTPAVVVVGDSLIWGLGTLTMANAMKNQTGRGTLVEATVGASWVNYGWPGQQDGPHGTNSLVWNLADIVNSRLTVVALATNDARIMTQSPGSYSAQTQYSIMHGAVDQIRNHSRCVLLVNVKPQTTYGPNGNITMSSAKATAVNSNMLWLATTYSRGGVYIADWASHASMSWFKPNDVHLTGAGSIYYRGFITAMAQHYIQHPNSQC